MSTAPRKRLGEYLLERGWITAEQLQRALQTHRTLGGRLGTCLLELDALPEDLLIKSLGDINQVPTVSVDEIRAAQEAAYKTLSPRVAKRCQAIPFRLEGNQVWVGMLDVHNLQLQDELGFVTGKRVKIFLANEVRVMEGMDRFYGEECPQRFANLVERLNRTRYLWERTTKVTPPEPREDLGRSSQWKSTQPITPPPLPRPAEPPPVPRSQSGPASQSAQSVQSVQSANSARVAQSDLSAAPALSAGSAGSAAPSPSGASAPPRLASNFPVGIESEPPPHPEVASAPKTESLNLRPRTTPSPRPRAAAPAVPPTAPAPKAQAPAASSPAAAAPATPARKPFSVPIAPEELQKLRRVGEELTFEQVQARLLDPVDRDAVGQALLGYLVGQFRRVALLRVMRDEVAGWMGAGELDPDVLRNFSGRFSEPSIFVGLRQNVPFARGPLAPFPLHRRLAEAWGGELPGECLLLPIRIKDRLVTIIYADRGKDGLQALDLEPLQRLTAKAGIAFELCIMRGKLKQA